MLLWLSKTVVLKADEIKQLFQSRIIREQRESANIPYGRRVRQSAKIENINNCYSKFAEKCPIGCLSYFHDPRL